MDFSGGLSTLLVFCSTSIGQKERWGNEPNFRGKLVEVLAEVLAVMNFKNQELEMHASS